MLQEVDIRCLLEVAEGMQHCLENGEGQGVEHRTGRNIDHMEYSWGDNVIYVHQQAAGIRELVAGERQQNSA